MYNIHTDTTAGLRDFPFHSSPQEQARQGEYLGIFLQQCPGAWKIYQVTSLVSWHGIWNPRMTALWPQLTHLVSFLKSDQGSNVGVQEKFVQNKQVNRRLTELPFGKLLTLDASNVSWENVWQAGSEGSPWPPSKWKVYRAHAAVGQHTWWSIRCYPPTVIMFWLFPRHGNARGAAGLGWRHTTEVTKSISWL